MYLSNSQATKGFIVQVAHAIAYLENTLEAQQLLNRFGDIQQRLQEGQVLLDQTRGISELLQDLKMRQKATTDSVQGQWQQAKHRYQLHLQGARRSLGREAKEILQGAPTGYANWMAHANTFYVAILNNQDFLEKLHVLTVTQDELMRAKQMLEGLAAIKNVQTQTRQSVRSLYTQRQEALQGLSRWHSELTAVARMAFRNHPGMLEALIPIQTRKRKKKDEPANGQLVANQSTASETVSSEPIPNGTILVDSPVL